MTALRAAVVAACVGAAGLAGIRWLRVAQREHYLPGAVTRFAWRWWTGRPIGVLGLVAAWVGAFLAGRWPAAGFVTAAIVAVGPVGLGLRGRTSALAWTRRAKTLAGIWLVLDAAVISHRRARAGSGRSGRRPWLRGPGPRRHLLHLAGPFERWQARTYVSRARRATSSGGAHGRGHHRLLRKDERPRATSPTWSPVPGSVVASPASFNNRAGLARAVNENLAEGTEVFVAEMGTYGPGRDRRTLFLVGPDHRRDHGHRTRSISSGSDARSGSSRPRPRSWSEAATVVLNVDDPRLGGLAEGAQERGQGVRRVAAVGPDEPTRPNGGSTSGCGDDGEDFAVVSPGPSGRPGGSGPAAGQRGLRRGRRPRTRGRRWPSSAGRLDGSRRQRTGCEAATAESGLRRPGRHLQRQSGRGRRRPRRPPAAAGGRPAGGGDAGDGRARTRGRPRRTRRFAAAVVARADELVVVGRTNRRALLAGAASAGEGMGAGEGTGAGGEPGAAARRRVVVDHREQAVAWVRQELGAGDVVLYENDLPDHYP